MDPGEYAHEYANEYANECAPMAGRDDDAGRRRVADAQRRHQRVRLALPAPHGEFFKFFSAFFFKFDDVDLEITLQVDRHKWIELIDSFGRFQEVALWNCAAWALTAGESFFFFKFHSLQ